MFLEILIFTKIMKGEELTWKIALSAKRIAEKPTRKLNLELDNMENDYVKYFI